MCQSAGFQMRSTSQQVDEPLVRVTRLTDTVCDRPKYVVPIALIGSFETISP